MNKPTQQEIDDGIKVLLAEFETALRKLTETFGTLPEHIAIAIDIETEKGDVIGVQAIGCTNPMHVGNTLLRGFQRVWGEILASSEFVEVVEPGGSSRGNTKH